MQVTPEEKRAWAEALLRDKYTELGRLRRIPGAAPLSKSSN